MKTIFKKPSLVALIGNINSGKSNVIYHIIDELRRESEFELYTYGLKAKIPGAAEIWSLEELETIKNSMIIIDEALSILDLDNRSKKRQIEQTFRLLHHRNNVLLLSLLPENCKKFIASKLDAIIFKKSTYADFINGSLVKRTLMQYRGPEAGSTLLDMDVNKALVFDGRSYKVVDVPYMEKYDSKKSNMPIFKAKKIQFGKKTA